jgi:hypothetical protein
VNCKDINLTIKWSKQRSQRCNTDIWVTLGSRFQLLDMETGLTPMMRRPKHSRRSASRHVSMLESTSLTLLRFMEMVRLKNRWVMLSKSSN